jgi:hypothetical protein
MNLPTQQKSVILQLAERHFSDRYLTDKHLTDRHLKKDF